MAAPARPEFNFLSMYPAVFTPLSEVGKYEADATFSSINRWTYLGLGPTNYLVYNEESNQWGLERLNLLQRILSLFGAYQETYHNVVEGHLLNKEHPITNSNPMLDARVQDVWQINLNVSVKMTQAFRVVKAIAQYLGSGPINEDNRDAIWIALRKNPSLFGKLQVEMPEDISAFLRDKSALAEEVRGLINQIRAPNAPEGNRALQRAAAGKQNADPVEHAFNMVQNMATKLFGEFSSNEIPLIKAALRQDLALCNTLQQYTSSNPPPIIGSLHDSTTGAVERIINSVRWGSEAPKDKAPAGPPPAPVVAPAAGKQSADPVEHAFNMVKVMFLFESEEGLTEAEILLIKKALRQDQALCDSLKKHTTETAFSLLNDPIGGRVRELIQSVRFGGDHRPATAGSGKVAAPPEPFWAATAHDYYPGPSRATAAAPPGPGEPMSDMDRALQMLKNWAPQILEPSNTNMFKDGNLLPQHAKRLENVLRKNPQLCKRLKILDFHSSEAHLGMDGKLQSAGQLALGLVQGLSYPADNILDHFWVGSVLDGLGPDLRMHIVINLSNLHDLENRADSLSYLSVSINDRDLAVIGTPDLTRCYEDDEISRKTTSAEKARSTLEKENAKSSNASKQRPITNDHRPFAQWTHPAQRTESQQREWTNAKEGLKNAILTAVQALQSNKNVLLHCVEGKNRSGVASAVIEALVNGTDYKTAWHHFREKRGKNLGADPTLGYRALGLEILDELRKEMEHNGGRLLSP